MYDDSYLISLLKKNNKEAYESVFRKYYRELLYIAFRYVDDPEDAKDLAQSTLIKLWEKRDLLLDHKPLKPYLLSIHKNNCLDMLKHKKVVEKVINIDSATKEEETAFNTPFDDLVSHDLELKILEAISQLPPRCRLIFEYSRFEGLKYSQIAKKLLISEKTVENQMILALEKLRIKLIDYLGILILFFIHH